jgi:16S rRNA (guanine527-N7)-methyltransferase
LNDDEIGTLTEFVSKYNVKLLPLQLDLFCDYMGELWEWNRHINLTGLSSKRDIVVELFLDSLIPAPFIPANGRLLDVGTGAGFPGIPLKIYLPNLKITLLEANSKKVSFLRHVIRKLGLTDIDVIKGRIEQGGNDLHQVEFPLITARAVAGLGQTLAWCAPYLSQGGLLVSFLGPHVDERLNENKEVMASHSVDIYKMIPYFLPGKKTKRHTVIFRKKV